MTIIRVTKDNQVMYFKTLLDCLRYFLADGDEKATKEDVNYSSHYSAFSRSKFKHSFDFGTVEKINAEKLEIYKIRRKLFVKNKLLLVPFIK